MDAAQLIKDRSLTSLKQKPIKIGAKVIKHGRYAAFQIAEVAIPTVLFAEVLRLIAERRPPPITSTACGVWCHTFQQNNGRAAS